jgi:hypothetical protein
MLCNCLFCTFRDHTFLYWKPFCDHEFIFLYCMNGCSDVVTLLFWMLHICSEDFPTQTNETIYAARGEGKWPLRKRWTQVYVRPETQLSASPGPSLDALLDPPSHYPSLPSWSNTAICNVFYNKLFVTSFINVKLEMSSFLFYAWKFQTNF